jgi:hypothetical protein
MIAVVEPNDDAVESADLRHVSRGRRPAGNFLVSCVRANLNVLGPSDLPETPDVNGLEERFVSQRGKNPSAYVSREVDDTLNAVGVSDADTEARKRFNFVRSNHGLKMSRHSTECKQPDADSVSNCAGRVGMRM